MIAIVDYGVGNVRAVQNMLQKLGVRAQVTGDANELKEATKIILPGVGAFDTAMKELENKRLLEVLNDAVLVQQKPVLGICLGMQLLTHGSEEGKCKGFGWIAANAFRFSSDGSLKVPHMKWNYVTPVNASALTQGLVPESKFYFVHSYYVQVEDKAHSLLQCEYGVTFDAAIQKGNVYGVQFHPEKSHKYGMQLLSNFVAL